MKSLDHKPFIYPLRVHIEDTDFAGVVYHSNYLNFLERARSEWGESLGIGIDWQRQHQIYLPVHSATLSYIKPARLHEVVEVVTTVLGWRKASVEFEQYLRLQASPDKIFFKAKLKVACVDHTMRPKAFPPLPFSVVS